MTRALFLTLPMVVLTGLAAPALAQTQMQSPTTVSGHTGSDATTPDAADAAASKPARHHKHRKGKHHSSKASGADTGAMPMKDAPGAGSPNDNDNGMRTPGHMDDSGLMNGTGGAGGAGGTTGGGMGAGAGTSSGAGGGTTR